MAQITRRDLFNPTLLQHYQMNPIDFIYDIIFGDRAVTKGGKLYLSDQQMQVLSNLVYDDKVSIVSGKGIGKTAFHALTGLWFGTVWDRAKVICTAPSKPQLMSALWPEYRKWCVGTPLYELFEITATKIYLKEDPLTFIEPRTASKDKPENMAGLHEDSMLIQVDEGSRVDDVVYHTIDGTLTGINNKLIVTSNGTRNVGWFYDSHHKEKDEWTTYKFSSEDSPFTSPQKIYLLKKKWGEDHNIVRCDVTGDFPKADPDSFIALDRVFAAMDREVRPTGDIEIGFDPALGGEDLSVLVWRQGNKVYPPVYEDLADGPKLEQMVYDLVEDIREKTGYTDKIKIKIDATGLGGPVAGYLEKDRLHNIEVYPINFAGGGDDRYANMPTRIWGSIERKIDHLDLPSEFDVKGDERAENAVERLRIELSTRKVDYKTGKIRIQPKAEYKKDVHFSPDFADALGLCLFEAKNPRTVLKTFDSQDSQTILNKLSYTHSLDRYVSVFYSRDRLASVVWAYWGNGTLSIGNELVTDDNIARIASEIRHRESQREYKKILGNDRCFGSNPREDIRGQFKNYQVRLSKNRRYDELGAIELLNELVVNKNLKVSRDCEEAIKQLNEWKMDASQVNLENDYGLAYAILNVVSELKEQIKPTVRPKMAYKPYSGKAKSETDRIVNRGVLL